MNSTKQNGAGALSDEQIDDWIATIATYDIAGPRLTGREQIHRFARAIFSSPDPAGAVALECYDAGLLSDFGGGNVDWWQDYIRAELARAHDHYQVQIDNLAAPASALPAREMEAWQPIATAIDALEILNRRPRPMCRDCADENGTCPSSGLPCDMSAVIRNARNALAAPASREQESGEMEGGKR